MRTAILGIGNPILRDDGVGPRLARLVHDRARAAHPDVEFIEVSTAGLNLLDLVRDIDRLVLIDAIITGERPPGTLRRLTRDDFKSANKFVTSHDVDALSALAAASTLGLRAPADIAVYAVEVADPWTFDEELTPEVAATLEANARQIAREQFPEPEAA